MHIVQQAMQDIADRHAQQLEALAAWHTVFARYRCCLEPQVSVLRIHSLVHDCNDETPVAVGRQELQIYEVVDEAIPVSVGQVDGGAHHGLAV